MDLVTLELRIVVNFLDREVLDGTRRDSARGRREIPYADETTSSRFPNPTDRPGFHECRAPTNRERTPVVVRAERTEVRPSHRPRPLPRGPQLGRLGHPAGLHARPN